MVERAVIERRLVHLAEYLADLKAEQDELTVDMLNRDKKLRRYIERTLQMAIETCLDIAHHIIAYEGFREPRDNRGAFSVMQEEQIVDADLGQRLEQMAGFRNILVHEYVRVDPVILHRIVSERLDDIRRFAVAVKERFV